MQRIILIVLIAGILLSSHVVKAQVGIGTQTPDTSAVLDLTSTDRGFLLSRLTTSERDAISGPANGLMIYNETTGEVQVNSGTREAPVWFGMRGTADTIVTSVTATGDISTTSLTSELIPGMTLSPPAGTYLVLFNGQYGLTVSAPISTAQGVTDLQAAYTELMAIPATDITHGPIFGNGEVLLPGVYDLPAAASLAGTLTMDGGGDSSAVFIIRVGGALAAGALTTVVLTNGASAENIFWISEGALSLAAGTIMKGTLISHAGAVAGAAGTNLVGRMFSLTGAISFGPGTAAIPTGPSYVDLGVLESFVIFTSVGAVGNTGTSMITGNVGTNAGAITGFGDFNGNEYVPGGAAPEPTNNTLATFSIYQNGEMIQTSTRTHDINTGVISLQSMATVDAGQTIEVWWNVDAGPVIMGNRILSLVSVD